MPNRIPTPGLPAVGVRSSALDNAAVNTQQHGTVGGSYKGPTNAMPSRSPVKPSMPVTGNMPRPAIRANYGKIRRAI